MLASEACYPGSSERAREPDDRKVVWLLPSRYQLESVQFANQMLASKICYLASSERAREPGNRKVVWLCLHIFIVRIRFASQVYNET